LSLERNASVLILLTCIVIAAGLIHWNSQKGIDMDQDNVKVEINDTDQASLGGCELDLQNPLEPVERGIRFRDKKILVRDGRTNNIQFTIEGYGSVGLWFQIKKTPTEGTRYSIPLPSIPVQNNETITICFIDETSSIWENNALPVMINDTIYLFDPWRANGTHFPTLEGWLYAFTTDYFSWTNVLLSGNITELSENSYISFDIHPRIIVKDTPVILNASNCYSPDRITEYRWQIRDDVLEGVKVEYVFPTAGNYTVTLITEDTNGEKQHLSKLYEVYLEKPAPDIVPKYFWVSTVMDSRIIDEKYAVLGTVRSREGDISPIIEYYDKQGNRLGNLTLEGEEWFYADCFTETRDGGILIAGTIQEPEPMEYGYYKSVFIKYSAEGEQLWNCTYGNLDFDANKLLETGDDVYTCLTTKRGSSMLIKLIDEGSRFSVIGFPSEYYDFTTTRDGGYLLVGDMMHLTKLDVNGSIEWTKTYPGPKRDWGSSVLELPDGYIVAGGTRNTENEEADILVLRMDAEGIPLWNKTYGGVNWDTAMDIVMVPDGFIITGQTHSFGDGGSDVWVLWISESGELYRSETYSKPGDIYTYECGQMIIQGFNQTAVVATASGEYGYEPWIIILD
jgi:hypothetical protein